MKPTPNLHWTELLKAKRNPLLASKPHHNMDNLVWGLGGAGLVAGFDLFTTVKLPKLGKRGRMLVHGGLAFASLLAPRSPFTAGMGGALFYAFISETYNSLLKE